MTSENTTRLSLRQQLHASEVVANPALSDVFLFQGLRLYWTISSSSWPGFSRLQQVPLPKVFLPSFPLSTVPSESDAVLRPLHIMSALSSWAVMPWSACTWKSGAVHFLLCSLSIFVCALPRNSKAM